MIGGQRTVGLIMIITGNKLDLEEYKLSKDGTTEKLSTFLALYLSRESKQSSEFFLTPASPCCTLILGSLPLSSF